MAQIVRLRMESAYLNTTVTSGEAEHKRPHEDGNLKLALSLDHAEELGVPSRNSEGNSVVSRRIILDEEASWYTLTTSSFLSKSSLDKPP